MSVTALNQGSFQDKSLYSFVNILHASSYSPLGLLLLLVPRLLSSVTLVLLWCKWITEDLNTSKLWQISVPEVFRKDAVIGM